MEVNPGYGYSYAIGGIMDNKNKTDCYPKNKKTLRRFKNFCSREQIDFTHLFLTLCNILKTEDYKKVWIWLGKNSQKDWKAMLSIGSLCH
jgi:hypothetical protein